MLELLEPVGNLQGLTSMVSVVGFVGTLCTYNVSTPDIVQPWFLRSYSPNSEHMILKRYPPIKQLRGLLT